jgi:hypothetical protein
MTKAIDEVNIHLLFGLRVVVCLHPVLQVIKIRECDIYRYNPDSVATMGYVAHLRTVATMGYVAHVRLLIASTVATGHQQRQIV